MLAADALEGSPDVMVCEVVLSESTVLRAEGMRMRLSPVAELVVLLGR